MTDHVWDGKTTGFGPQTVIETTEGPVPIEWLSTTHRVVTRDHGPQPILAIEHHVLRALDGDYLPLMEVAAGAFAEGAPDHTLVLPPHHRVLLEGSDIELHFGMPVALCHCADLLDGVRVKCRNMTGAVPFYTLLMAGHEVVKANGIWVETMEIEQNSSQVSLEDLTPDIFAKLRLEGGAHRLAHPCLEPWEGRLLARSHARNEPLWVMDVA